eukprot:c16426_g1_i3.p2 GENE.c16426_g1_i3~~c16426_g1_i3.p2  ORF type:complete len:244 (+),score=30.80 c16426_g1_i3:78-734(+)
MKASLDFFNWLYWLLGAAVLGAGIYVHVVYQWGSQLLGISLSLAIIIAGAVIVGLTLLGCWGVRTDWWMVLNTYLVATLLLICCEVCISTLSVLYRDNLIEELYQGWLDTTDVLRSRIQLNLGCCGFFSANDSPGSRCPVGASVGCFYRLQQQLQARLFYFALGGFVLAAIQLFAVLFAGCVVAIGDDGHEHVQKREQRKPRRKKRNKQVTPIPPPLR